MKKELVGKYKKLSELKPGEIAKVISFEGGKGLVAHLNDMGIRKDSFLEIISNTKGPVCVKCGESRFAIGHEMANKIIVSISSAEKQNNK